MYQVEALSHRILRGSAIVIPDNVKSGMIVPIGCRGAYQMDEFKDHCFNNLDIKLKSRIAPGDIIVAGHGFAKGETGEESTMALMGLKVGAVVAQSVNRIFLRNSINLGFPVIILPIAHEMIGDGDMIEIDPLDAIVRNITRGLSARGKLFPSTFRKILEAGGIVNYILSESEKKKVKHQPG
jgi:3-isopropylmalate/(R)-2-methylmalate dehydratase small subunit